MDEVLYEVRNQVAWITLNRPEVRNALNKATREGLFGSFNRFEKDEEAKVAVITGAGDKAFSAGADLKEMAETQMQVPPRDFVVHLNRNVFVTKPVIAAVNGVAYGGGFLLAQMCDLCLAVPDARFGITEAKVGRGAPWAAPLPWMIPPRVAMEMLLTGEPISGERAYEVGLVNKVVPLEQLHEEAQRLGELIAGNAPLSVKASKAMLYAVADIGWLAGLEIADKIWEPVYKSEDAQEGPRAFKEKRAPRWKGR